MRELRAERQFWQSTVLFRYTLGVRVHIYPANCDNLWISGGKRYWGSY